MSRKERDWWRVEGKPNLDLQFLASRWKVEKKRKPFAANARGIRIIALDSSFLSGCGRFKAFFSLSRFSLPSISSFSPSSRACQSWLAISRRKGKVTNEGKNSRLITRSTPSPRRVFSFERDQEYGTIRSRSIASISADWDKYRVRRIVSNV